MVLKYSFPSTIYRISPNSQDLDEIQIMSPPISPATIPQGVATTAKMTVEAVTQTLTSVIVRITMTRSHSLSLLASANPGGPNPLAPVGAAAAGWNYSQSNVEATWTGPSITLGAAPMQFEVEFTPTVTGNYTYTFSVDTAELRQAAMTQVDVTVV